MKKFKNGSFMGYDRLLVSNHKARLKTQNKRKNNASRTRRELKFKILYAWNTNNVRGWTINMFKLGYKNLAGIHTIKKGCLYSDRTRSVNSYLGLSKYLLADYSRRGLIKDFKKF